MLSMISIIIFKLVMTKPVRIRLKACDHCQVSNIILFRIVHDATGKWVFICDDCRLKVQNQPFYRYGGTWKVNKRH